MQCSKDFWVYDAFHHAYIRRQSLQHRGHALVLQPRCFNENCVPTLKRQVGGRDASFGMYVNLGVVYSAHGVCFGFSFYLDELRFISCGTELACPDIHLVIIISSLFLKSVSFAMAFILHILITDLASALSSLAKLFTNSPVLFSSTARLQPVELIV